MSTQSLLSCPLSQLIGITDGYLSLLQDSGEVREDLKIPEGDLGKEIESKHEAGEEILVSTATSSHPQLFCSNKAGWTLTEYLPLCVLSVEIYGER